MAKGFVDFIPEMADLSAAWLPRGITETARENYGGAVRLEIDGKAIEEGATYQVVVTDSPLLRCIELRKSPAQGA